MTDYASLWALAEQVLALCRHSGLTIGTAESLTGGMISAALSSVPGSSDVLRGGVVSYASEVKENLLGVRHHAIEVHGVVSCEVAEEMAIGALEVIGCDCAVAVTGIAGPGGAEPGKPVGTVCIAYADAVKCLSRRFVFSGNREDVRTHTVQEALTMLMENAPLH